MNGCEPKVQRNTTSHISYQFNKCKLRQLWPLTSYGGPILFNNDKWAAPNFNSHALRGCTFVFLIAFRFQATCTFSHHSD